MWYMIRNLCCTVTIDSVLANSKTERFLIHCERHFSSRLHPSGGTWKYAKAPSTKEIWRDSLPIDMLLSAVFVLVVAQSSSEIPEGLMNNPVLQHNSDTYFCPFQESYFDYLIIQPVSRSIKKLCHLIQELLRLYNNTYK